MGSQTPKLGELRGNFKKDPRISTFSWDISPIITSRDANVDTDFPLDDVEVKSFLLFAAVALAVAPYLVANYLVQSPLIWIWIVISSTFLIQQYSNRKIEWAQPHARTWNHAMFKLSIAIFDVGISLSRLAVLVFIMAAPVGCYMLKNCLGSLFVACGMASEHYWRIHAAAGDFWRSLKKCDSNEEVVQCWID